MRNQKPSTTPTKLVEQTPADVAALAQMRAAAAYVLGSVGNGRPESEHQSLLDELCAIGAITAQNDFVLVRAITEHDVPRSTAVTTTLEAPNAEDALMFQIVDVGPGCSDRVKGALGHFCTSLATFINPIANDKPSRYAFLRGDTVPGTIDPEMMENLVRGDLQRIHQEKTMHEAMVEEQKEEKRKQKLRSQGLLD